MTLPETFPNRDQLIRINELIFEVTTALDELSDAFHEPNKYLALRARWKAAEAELDALLPAHVRELSDSGPGSNS